ncbi:MAG: hypothetical protein H7X71_07375 [Chitinophagales bacterium]|nr:hypothetical protein [Chitinophagales bacterium]
MLFAIFFAFFVSSCLPLKYSKGARSGKYYTDFFINDSTTQIFVMPLTFQGRKADVEMDFTFRNNCRPESATSTNFTLHSSFALMRTIQFSNTTGVLGIYDLKQLYKEPVKDRYTCRYTTDISNAFFYSLLGEDNFFITLTNETDTLQLEMTNKSGRIIDRIGENIQTYLNCK